MKCIYVKCVNYIGIWNGLGLKEFELDLSKTSNKILMLVGRNGSGKSTIASDILTPTASSLTDQSRKKVILKGKDGYKEIHYKKNDSTVYVIKHYFKFKKDIKKDTYKHTIKSYITKICYNEGVELNPNGNVSSFKEILESEFEFDSNAAKLLSLSSEGSSFVNMSFTDRKNYINEAKDDLETYSNYSKAVTVKFRDAKTLLNNIVDTLNRIGDIDILNDQRDNIKSIISNLKSNLNDTVSKLALSNSSYNGIIDKDNLENKSIEIDKSLGRCNTDISVLRDVLDKYRNSATFNNVEEDNFNAEYMVKYSNTLSSEIYKLKSNIMLHDSTVANSLKDIERYREMLDDKQIKLDAYEDGLDINVINETKVLCETKISNYEDAFSGIGKLDTDTLIKADSVLTNMNNALTTFQSNYTNSDIEELIDLYDQGINPSHKYTKKKMGIMNERSRVSNELNKIDHKLVTEREKLNSDIDSELKPSNCKINNCPLANITTLREVTNIKIDEYEGIADTYKTNIENIDKEIDRLDVLVEMSMSWSNILNSISMNYHILNHVPDKRIVKMLEFSNMLDGLHHNRVKLDFHLGKYIEASQLYSEYERYKDVIYPDILKKLDQYNSKIELIHELKSSMKEVESFISRYKNDMDIANAKIIKNTKIIANYEQLLPKIESLIMNLNQYYDKCKERNSIVEDKAIIDKSMKEIISYKNDITDYTNQIDNIENDVSNYEDTLMDINHKISTFKEYDERRIKLEKTYRRYDILKSILSARTGIPLVFMEVYLKETAIFANKLLDSVTQGKYQLLEFIINETEFRIPCVKAGAEKVSDVKVMSQGERSIISICLSFALAYQASPVYNILTLDEMDGPLDVIYKEKYIEVMEKQMDLFNTEQIIMISHNDAFFNYPVDIILLDGHDKMIKDELPLANILYKHK